MSLVFRLLSAVQSLLMMAAGTRARSVARSGARTAGTVGGGARLGGMARAALAGNKASRRALGSYRRALLVVVLSCGALLGVGAGPASAAVTHQFESSFTGSDVTGTPAGPFSRVGANAFDQAGDAVYVVDWGRQVVDKFSAAGTYAGVQIAGASTPAGSFAFSPTSGVAVDNSGLGTDASNGDVYVANSGHGVVDKFTSSGSFVCQITGEGSASTDPAQECSTSQAGVGSITPTGLAVDANGNLWVADSAHDVIDEFDPSGNYVRQISDPHITSPATIALDASGDLYVDNLDANVVEFDSTGAFAGTVDSNPAISVSVDPVTAHVYVAEPGQIAEYDSTGNLIDTFGSGKLSEVFGLAVRGSTGEVYADDFIHDAVEVFGPDAVIPDVTTGPATGVQQFFATVNGTVDPAGGGNVTSCQFEYGTSTSYGQTAPCSPATPYAGATNVSASLSVLQAGTTYHFRVEASNSNGIVSFGSDQTFTTPGAVVTGQATSFTGNGATLNGTVTPDSTTITDCHFEYGTTTSYGQSQPCAATPSGGSSPVAVSAAISGLQADTTYHFRLVATNQSGTFDGADATFESAGTPAIDAAYTTNLTDTSVDLNAQINSNKLDTTYHLEYGTSTSYGNTVPVPDADIGSGTSDVPVTQQVSGLSANTTYHWRVVATNAAGTTDGGDQTFVYQPGTPSGAGCPNTALRYGYGAELPDCRAYEQVSPVDKNDSDVAHGVVNQQASVDGNEILYQANGAFPGAPNAGGQSQYLASRGANGWTSQPIGFPLTAAELDPGQAEDTWLPLSPDLSTGVLSQADPPLVASAPAGYWNLYVGQLGAGPYQLVTNVTPPHEPPSNFVDQFEGASADFSDVIFLANDALTPNAQACSGCYDLYEWTGGQLQLVGQIPASGTSCTGAACTPAARSFGGAAPTATVEFPSYDHAISADGSRIFFTASADTGAQNGLAEVFERVNGSSTVEVSAPAAGATPSNSTPEPAIYQGASADGSLVFFTSSEELTSDANTGSANAGNDLYEFNTTTGALTDLSVDTNPADAATGADVQGLVATSSDGSYVYFVADGVLTSAANSQGDTAVDGQPNLYLSHGGQMTFIATVDPGDGLNRGEVRVSADGTALAFDSTASPTGYDNSDASDGTPDSEVFLYNATSTTLLCASCNPSGARPIGSSTLHYTPWAGLYQPRNLIGDGSRLFFTSSDALVPDATNGLDNVYEWEADGSGSCQSTADNGGCLYLISDGRGDTNSYFADASASGNDVFFVTGDRLVGQDEDDYDDLYDARVDGGLASQDPSPAPPACSGDACQGALSPAPAVPTAASVTFSGPGNAAGGGAASARPRVLTRTVHGAAFMVRVSVPGAGQITVSGAGVGTARKTVGRKGTYAIRMSLTQADRRALARAHRLTVMLHVGYHPPGNDAQTASVRLTVMPALRHRSRRAQHATANTIRRAGK